MGRQGKGGFGEGRAGGTGREVPVIDVEVEILSLLQLHPQLHFLVEAPFPPVQFLRSVRLGVGIGGRKGEGAIVRVGEREKIVKP